MEIITENKNPLLNRTEIVLKLEAGQNPGFAGALKAVSEKTGVAEEKIAVKAVKSSYGKSEFLIEANVYDSAEDKTRVEPKPKVKKDKSGAEAKK